MPAPVAEFYIKRVVRELEGIRSLELAWKVCEVSQEIHIVDPGNGDQVLYRIHRDVEETVWSKSDD